VRNKYFWAAAFWTIIIVVSCLISMKTIEKATNIHQGDKYVHLVFYFIFTILWYFFIRIKRGNTAKTRLVVFLWGFLFGLLIEACQHFLTTDRNADVEDVIANTSGSALAVLVLWIIDKVNKKNNTNPGA
jgi:VanZ family protein